ncbi:MAG: carotenoid biosynthesis protein [Bacteroidota bacterium]
MQRRDQLVYLSIGIVWLFHVSALIGIFLGYFEWFIVKTPLNLMVSFILLLTVGGKHAVRTLPYIILFAVLGFSVEWIGVHTGFPFGSYTYGNNLGIKLDGIPPMIGVNWAMLTVITGAIAFRYFKGWKAILAGATLMVGIDFFIEPIAAPAGFWSWANDAIPVSNYIAWFVIAMFFHWIYMRFIRSYNFLFSVNLYLAQLLFFVALNLYL